VSELRKQLRKSADFERGVFHEARHYFPNFKRCHYSVNLDLTVDPTQIGGNRNASVVLVEFADYECPYCRQFAKDTMKQVEHDYIENGRIGFVFRDFPIESSHPNASSAALAALCAGEQGHLWEMK
jgi:protein-disulfide isomerase